MYQDIVKDYYLQCYNDMVNVHIQCQWQLIEYLHYQVNGIFLYMVAVLSLLLTTCKQGCHKICQYMKMLTDNVC